MSAEEGLHSASVVMVSYHTGPYLWIAIEAVLEQAGLHELILVDNGNPTSVSDRLRRLAETNSRVHLVQGHGNVGFARGCNLGSGYASGEYIALVNPDTILPPYGLMRLMDVLRYNPQAAMAGPRLLHPDGTEQAGSRRNLLTLATSLSESFRLYRFSQRFPRFNLHRDPVPESVVAVPAISGACMMLRLSEYRSLAGMDESYFLHVEDLDFCRRLGDRGREILFVPDVETVHFLSTSRIPSRRVERWKTESFIRYFERYDLRNTPPPMQKLARLALWSRYALGVAVKTLRAYLPSRNHAAKMNAMRRILWMVRGPEAEVPATFDGAGTPQHGPVLLTGATAPVGLAILMRLLAEGMEVIAIRHQTWIPFAHRRLRWVSCDLSRHSLPETALGCQTLIHAASIDLLAAPHIQSLKQAGLKRIIAFSDHAIEAWKHSASPAEQDTVRRLRQGESNISLASDMEAIHTTILRPVMPYGLGLDRWSTRIFNRIRCWRCLAHNPPGIGLRNPVQVDDLARAALSIFSNPATYGKTYTLAGAETLTWRELAERHFSALEKPARFIPLWGLTKTLSRLGRLIPRAHVWAERLERHNRDIAPSSRDAIEDFNYAPRGFEPDTGSLP